MHGKTLFLRLVIIVGALLLLAVSFTRGAATDVQSFQAEQSLTVSAASDTVVITDGAQMSDLDSGTYEVSVVSDLNLGSGNPDFDIDKVIVWANTVGNPKGWYWVVDEDQSQRITIPLGAVDVRAFLLDTDDSDNVGDATVTFRPCCPPTDVDARSVEVSGESNTVVMTDGAHLALGSGSYDVSVSSDLNLGSGLPGFNVDKVVVWASSERDPHGWYWIVEEGQSQTITISGVATEVWAFPLDIDTWGNTGSATVTFVPRSTSTPTPTATSPPSPTCGAGSVDVVFVMDTSESMADEFSALCTRIPDIVAELGSWGLTVEYDILGITQIQECATGNVKALISGGTVDHPEDWGPAVVDLSSHYAWEPGYTRLIIPMSDEGPQDGEPEQDPGPDRDVIDEAIATARSNQVVVSPVQGTKAGSTGDAAIVEHLMRDLAAGTGGLYFRTAEPDSDLAEALVNLIGSASCTPVIESVSPDCGITASTEVTVTGQGFLEDATVELRAIDSQSWFAAENATFVSDTEITVQVPAGLGSGPYELRVVNPGNQYSSAVTILLGTGTCPSHCPEIPETTSFTHYFRNVTVDGEPAPIGTLVEAFNPRGDLVGCFEVTVSGEYGNMRVYGEDASASPPIPGMRTLEPVTFKVDGQCTDTWPAPVRWIDDKGYHAVDLSTPCQPDQRIPLHDGWNWFSINRMPSDPQPTTVLSSIEGKYDLVLGEYGVYSPPPADPAFNTLFTILPGEGYMIRMTGEAQEPNPLLMDGALVPTYTPIPLHAGWDWFGYFPQQAMETSRALLSLIRQYDVVYGENGEYRPPPAIPTENTLTHLEPGRGYMIHMRRPGALIYPTTESTGQAATETLRAVESPGQQTSAAVQSPEESCDVTPTPHFTHYFGDIEVNGMPARSGVVVRAFSPRGEEVGCFGVTAPGLYGYMRVYGVDPENDPLSGTGMRSGEPATFRVDGMPAEITPAVAWHDDKDTHEVQLSVTIYTQYLPLVVR